MPNVVCRVYIDAQDGGGPLHVAAAHGHADIINRFLQYIQYTQVPQHQPLEQMGTQGTGDIGTAVAAGLTVADILKHVDKVRC